MSICQPKKNIELHSRQTCLLQVVPFSSIITSNSFRAENGRRSKFPPQQVIVLLVLSMTSYSILASFKMSNKSVVWALGNPVSFHAGPLSSQRTAEFILTWTPEDVRNVIGVHFANFSLNSSVEHGIEKFAVNALLCPNGRRWCFLHWCWRLVQSTSLDHRKQLLPAGLSSPRTCHLAALRDVLPGVELCIERGCSWCAASSSHSPAGGQAAERPSKLEVTN